MMITKDNFNDVNYENEDARLLVLDVVVNNDVGVLCSSTEFTLAMALDIWYKVNDDRKRKILRNSLPKSHHRYRLIFQDIHEYVPEAV